MLTDEYEYTLGNGKAPNWCKKRIREYRKPNGEMGYEVSGHKTLFDLVAGDKIVRVGKWGCRIERKGGSD